MCVSGGGAVKSNSEAILWNWLSFFFKKRKRKTEEWAEGKKVQKTEGLFLDQPLQLWIFYSGQGKKFWSSRLHIRCRTKMLQAQAGYCGEKWNSTDVTVLPALLGSWWGMAPFFVLFEDRLSCLHELPSDFQPSLCPTKIQSWATVSDIVRRRGFIL